MIERLFNASAIGRLTAAVRRRWPEGLLGRASERLRLMYASGVTRAALYRWADGGSFMGAAGASGHTPLYAALLTRLNGALYRAGSTAGRLWRGSALRAVCARLSASPVLRESRFLKALRGIGVRRPLLLMFALYLPLDVLARLPSMPDMLGPLWHNALLLACVLYVLLRRMARRTPGHYTPIDAPMLLFMGLCVFLLFYNSAVFSVGLSGMRATAQYLLWFLVLSRMVSDRRDWELVYRVMVLMGAVLAVHGIYQYITAAPIPVTWLTHTEMGVRSRAFSITGSPNIMGDLMVMLMPLSVALAYQKGLSWERKLFWWGCAGVQGLACLVTFSRGAWLGLMAAAIVFIALQDRRLFFILLASAAVIIFIPDVMNRLSFVMTDDFAVASQVGGRAGRQEIGFMLLRGSGYLFGMGHGRYGGAVAMQNPIVEWLTYHYLDNYYLKTLVETGIAGLSAYLLLIAVTIATLFRAAVRVRGTYMRPRAAAILASAAGVLTHCMFENIFEVPYMSAYFWGLAALACAAARMGGESS